MSSLQVPRSKGKLSTEQQKKAREKVWSIKANIRTLVLQTVNLSVSGFYDKLDELFKNDRKGLSPESIAAKLSFDDCTMLYAYYSDMVTRAKDGHAINAYGAGYLAYRMIVNDVKKLTDEDNISAAKLCSTASLILYDKAIKEKHWPEYQARRFLVRDAFYLYPERLGKNRLMDGEVKSTFWTDAVTLTKGEQGWENVLKPGYALNTVDSVLTPYQLAYWWKNLIKGEDDDTYVEEEVEESNELEIEEDSDIDIDADMEDDSDEDIDEDSDDGDDEPQKFEDIVGKFSYADILHCIHRKLASWKVVCLIGYLVKSRIIGKKAGNKAYSMIYNEYKTLKDHNQSWDSYKKLKEYATYFGLKGVESYPVVEDVLRESVVGATDTGVLFSAKAGAVKKTSMRDKIAAKLKK